MTERDDGGPAYPVVGELDTTAHYIGMSLRDHFAEACDVSAYDPKTSFRTNRGRWPNVSELAEYIAEIRYLEADAMLKARKQ